MSKHAILSDQEGRTLRRFLNKCWAYPDEVFPDDAIEHIEAMFAPYLQREVSRQKIWEILGAMSKTVGGHLEALGALERLLNGVEESCNCHGTGRMHLSSIHEELTPGESCGIESCKPHYSEPCKCTNRPVCPTCGGSKEVCESYRMQNCDLQGTGWDPRKCRVEIDAKRCSLGMNYLSEPCPDCAEKVKVPNVCPTNWIAPKVQTSSEKPLCSTCSGSEKVPVIVGHICSIFPCNHDRKPCPDCTEKPICLRCGLIKSPGFPLYCYDEDLRHRFVDQRKGGERRQWRGVLGRRRGMNYGRRLVDADRREGDRRSKILTGSLKAMRPQE